MPKAKSKKSSKKSSKKLNSKKLNTKKASVTKSYSPPSQQNFFSFADMNVFEILKSYKDIYEYIVYESLRYKIEFTPINSSLAETTVSYYPKGTNDPYSNARMHIVGYLDGNTWTWNEYQKQQHYTTFVNYVVPLLVNLNAANALQKLFTFTQITFPDKYRHTIPYLLSYMYDPSRANIIRFSNDLLSNHSYTFVYMELPLNISNWYLMTDHIAKQFNVIGYGGGKKSEDTKNKRLLKDYHKVYYYKNCNILNNLIKNQRF